MNSIIKSAEYEKYSTWTRVNFCQLDWLVLYIDKEKPQGINELLNWFKNAECCVYITDPAKTASFSLETALMGEGILEFREGWLYFVEGDYDDKTDQVTIYSEQVFEISLVSLFKYLSFSETSHDDKFADWYYDIDIVPTSSLFDTFEKLFRIQLAFDQLFYQEKSQNLEKVGVSLSRTDVTVPRKRNRFSWRNRFKAKGEESLVQQTLKRRLGGQTEVITPSGRIDLLTDEWLIEIKEASFWKNGIGQVLAYQVYYPHHKKRLHLFGKCINLPEIVRVCATLGIEVSLHDAAD